MRFRDIFKGSRRPAVMSDGADGVAGGIRRLDGDVEVLVKGESHYQDALSAICGGKCAEGYFLPVTATLQAEPTNPYDPRAIAVSVEGRLVGYLPRDVAATMHSEFIRLSAGRLSLAARESLVVGCARMAMRAISAFSSCSGRITWHSRRRVWVRHPGRGQHVERLDRRRPDQLAGEMPGQDRLTPAARFVPPRGPKLEG